MSTGRKILAGAVIAAVVIAGLGYGGLQWAQRKALSEVDSVFTGLRTTFAKADYGAVAVNVWDRSVKISDIVLLPKDAPADAPVKIAEVNASGVNIVPGRVGFARVDIRAIEGTVSVTNADVTTRQKIDVPSVAITGLSVPSVSGPPAAGQSKAVQIIQGLIAASIVAPAINTNAVVIPPAASIAVAMPTNIQQSFGNVRMDGVAAGKVAKLTAEKWALTGVIPAQGSAASGPLTFGAKDLFATGYDLSGMMALMEASQAPNAVAGFTTLLQSAGIGATTFKIGNQVSGSLAGAMYSSLGMDVQKYAKSAKVIQSVQAAGVRISADQQAALVDSMADLYESIQIGKFETSGVALDVAGSPPFKLGAMTIENWQVGTIGSVGFTGLDTATPQGDKVQIGRFALKGIKAREFLRVTSQLNPSLAKPGQQQPQITEVLRLFNGIEIEGLNAPNPAPGQPPFAIEAFKANWGQLVGRTPVTATITAKFATPIPTNVPEPYAALIRGGLTKANVRFDGKWNWQEATQTFAVGPVEFEVQDAFAASAAITVGNVSRAVVSAGPEAFTGAAQDFQLGPMAVSLRDLGLYKIAAGDPKLNAQRQDYAEGLAQLAGGPATEPMTVAAQGMLKLFSAPNGRLAITVAPKTAIRIGDLVALGIAGPELADYLLPKVDIRVSNDAP
jgi:hypothetical protein